ncbi:PIN domain-containing protein [Jeotgalibacillus malaysiensis]|uniref:PIN domain-containing protein n=1 Tax=Jeotgalibacillus malaysiensis TaxID=1508404 RepID=UPI00384D7D36
MSLMYRDPPKVLIDTTVLCGAIRRPGGVNEKILKLGRTDLLYRPVISKLCLLEFYRKATEGLGLVTFTPKEIETYIHYMISPILELHPPVNSAVGRYSIETVIREHRPLKEVLELLSGYTIEEADDFAASSELEEPLHQFDQNDFHVWITAVQTECDLIVTSNTKRFPKHIGNIKRIHPSDFYRLIIEDSLK